VRRVFLQKQVPQTRFAALEGGGEELSPPPPSGSSSSYPAAISHFSGIERSGPGTESFTHATGVDFRPSRIGAVTIAQ
jgi:hypothetical protein